MDTLTLRTERGASEANAYTVRWQWRQKGAKLPLAGEIAVTVDPMHANDRAALAELLAIQYLLEVRQIHGEKRMGKGVAIEVSLGSIRKALLKGSLKASGMGKTDKDHVATCAEFLATKYFETTVSVGTRWHEGECKSFEATALELGAQFPRLRLPCPLLGEPVAITRHGLYRFIARIDQRLSKWDEDDLTKVPDTRFTAAWHTMEKVLVSKRLDELHVRKGLSAAMAKKYGATTRYLKFSDALVPAVLVLRKDATGYVLATVLREDQANFVEKPGYIVGQRVVSAHIHERKKFAE